MLLLARCAAFRDDAHMKILLSLIGCLIFAWPAFAADDVLIVADEIPAMEFLASKLRNQENLTSKIVLQTAMPADISPYSAVVVYIHKALGEPAEKAFIEYTKAGGKLVVLHHSISSGKRKNKEWFTFLGVSLPEGDVNAGGYKWLEPVTLDIVNLAPDHFITTNKVQYPAKTSFKCLDGTEKPMPAFTLNESEVYLNHVLTGTRTLLLGLRFADSATGRVWMQNHAGWVKQSGNGWIVYLLPGHSILDFENPAYARIVLNAVIWKP